MHSCHTNKIWYKNKLFLASLATTILYLSSYFFPIMEQFRFRFGLYFREIWWAILLGLFIGGIIERFVPEKYVTKLLSNDGKYSILNAVSLGFAMSVCSHGILALAIQIYKKGASIPSVIAFLLAAPWANISITILLISFFGVKNAIFIICSALIVAITTGYIFVWLDKKNLIEKSKKGMPTKDFSIIEDIKKRSKQYKVSASQFKEDIKIITKGSISLGNMVAWWILIGVVFASLAGAYIPHHIFQDYMGATASGMGITLIAATLLEICSEGTAPMAFELFLQTGAIGNSFVFLMAGVATDYTEIGLLWYNIGRKTALWLPIITTPQILFFGAMGNWLL